MTSSKQPLPPRWIIPFLALYPSGFKLACALSPKELLFWALSTLGPHHHHSHCFLFFHFVCISLGTMTFIPMDVLHALPLQCSGVRGSCKGVVHSTDITWSALAAIRNLFMVSQTVFQFSQNWILLNLFQNSSSACVLDTGFEELAWTLVPR